MTEPLPLSDQIELAVKQLEEIRVFHKSAVNQAKARIAQLIEQARPIPHEVIAEIYWRFEEVPSTLLWPAGQGAYTIARQYPYWQWTCRQCGTDVSIRSREELRQFRRGQGRSYCDDCLAQASAERETTWIAEQARLVARERELCTMPYREYLQTPEWQERRKAALRRAKYACQVCNRQRQLHVHHRTYERRGAELSADLIVLCDECHALYHRKGLLVADEERDGG